MALDMTVLRTVNLRGNAPIRDGFLLVLSREQGMISFVESPYITFPYSIPYEP